MQRSDPAASGPGSQIILAAGDAIAVLALDAAGTSASRIAAAEAALRDACDRSGIAVGVRASGRPRLAPPYPELGVSISHRDGVVLAAFSPSRDVGADIEIEAGDLDVKLLARDHFTSGEAAALADLSKVLARDLFFRLWVAKEAALKMTGRGIFDGLGEPDLSPQLGALKCDGRAFAVPAGQRVPGLLISVRRLELAGQRAVYCGLAVHVE